jgi:hypothetical protein
MNRGTLFWSISFVLLINQLVLCSDFNLDAHKPLEAVRTIIREQLPEHVLKQFLQSLGSERIVLYRKFIAYRISSVFKKISRYNTPFDAHQKGEGHTR